MKRFRTLLPVLVLLLLMPLLGLLGGCEDGSFESDAYKALVVAGTSYDATMSALADAHGKQLISDGQWSTAKDVARVYYGLFHTARIGLAEYVRLPPEKRSASAREKVQATIAAMTLRLAELLSYARSIGVGVQAMTTEKE